MRILRISTSLSLTLFLFFFHASADNSTFDITSRSYYTKAHSLGEAYDFHPRDGWQSVNVTSMPYKYRRAKYGSGEPNELDDKALLDLAQRSSKGQQTNTKNFLNGIVHSIEEVWNGLKGVGKQDQADVTWYTGHDLLNPSCWANTKWIPTDQSFATAVTLVGWTSRPKCFSFLELCNGPKKCVFVRVIDTCAGCAPGSKHLDLTQAAFTALAPLSVGALKVQYRHATEPEAWYQDLWGPKAG